MNSFESVHTDDLRWVGPAYPGTPCAKCSVAGLKHCFHNVSVSAIDAARVEARVIADIQASINPRYTI